jgi:DinB superfamily
MYAHRGVLKMQSLIALQELIDRLPARLQSLPSDKVESKPASDKWSAKEELGHLLDSAANNHQRIVRTQLEEHPAMPGYDGDAWVALHQYQRRDWPSLIDRWTALNRQLLAAAEAVPGSAWTRTCTIADSGPLTLRFVFDDYIHHMLDHLRHMGVEVDDFGARSAAAGQS